jgi:hypothetical protein
MFHVKVVVADDILSFGRGFSVYNKLLVMVIKTL